MTLELLLHFSCLIFSLKEIALFFTYDKTDQQLANLGWTPLPHYLRKVTADIFYKGFSSSIRFIFCIQFKTAAVVPCQSLGRNSFLLTEDTLLERLQRNMDQSVQETMVVQHQQDYSR